MKSLWQLSNSGESPCEYADLAELCAPRQLVPRNRGEFVAAFLPAFREACQDALASVAGRNLVVFHSSGYDSRLLGHCVHDCLPDSAIWACLPPEHEDFVNIMRKFYRHQRHVLLPQQDNPRFVGAINYLRGSLGWSLESVSVLMAGYFNEIFDHYMSPRPALGVQADGSFGQLKDWVRFYHEFKYARIIGGAGIDVRYPLLHAAPLRIILESALPLSRDLRKDLLRHADSDLLAMPRTVGM